MHNLPEEILFGHFMTTVNNPLEMELTWDKEGYESGTESLNIPTPLRRVPRLYHVSMMEDISFNTITPLTTAKQYPVHLPCRFRYHSPVHHHLVFIRFDDESPLRPCDPYLQHSSTPDSCPVHRGAEPPLVVQYDVYHQLTSTPSMDQFFKDDTGEEIFPTVPLDDDICFFFCNNNIIYGHYWIIMNIFGTLI